MKKKLWFLFFSLSLVLVLTACNGSKTNQGQDNFQLNKPDFGQPESEADLRGVVKSITGNGVVILKIDQAQNNPLSASSTEEQSGRTEERASAGLSLNGGAMTPPTGGGGPGGGPGERTDSEDSRAAMMERLKEMSTGEETIKIPVGIQMLKFSNTNGKREAVEASLSDISADQMITVWLDKSITDSQTASFVFIN
jgi:hypothetical protein